MKSGFGQMARDTLIRDEIQERIDRVVLTFDAKSGIRDKAADDSASFYSLQLNGKDLLVTANLKDCSSWLYHFEVKMDKILNMRFAQSKRDWDKVKRKEQMAKVCCFSSLTSFISSYI